MHPFDAQQLAVGLIQEHGLIGWRFRFDHARRRFGCCRSSEKTITLSRPLTILNSCAQVRDTILHEIAHALTPGDGHGVKWRAKCREIGADPKRWKFLTGDPKAVARVAESFGVLYYPERGQIVHSQAVAVVDPRGRLANIYYGEQWTPEGVIEDLQKARKG